MVHVVTPFFPACFLQRDLFAGFERAELAVLVDEDDDGAARADDHVGLAIAIDILERERDGDRSSPLPISVEIT